MRVKIRTQKKVTHLVEKKLAIWFRSVEYFIVRNVGAAGIGAEFLDTTTHKMAKP